jgi:endonuclease-8
MPEGPSIVILKEDVQFFKGKKILEVSGNSKEDIALLKGQTIIDFKSWGKHFLICFKTFTVRIHLMMFGSYRVNERKDSEPRLSLKFKKGELNFYTCSVKIFEGSADDVYDWSGDVMSDNWDPKAARKKLKAQPAMLACDALLDQQIFAGVGNIIKNEVLFRIKVHPACAVGMMPAKKLTEMIKEARIYSFEFLEWKKKFELKKHWLAYTKKMCPRDHVPFIKAYLGKTHRRTFFCTVCQELYSE